MDNSVIVEIVENFTMAMLAIPVVLLGMWLATKRWPFYSIAVVGFVWMAYVISGAVGELCANPEVSTSVRVAAWTIPPIFFTVLNVGAIATIQGTRRGRVVEKIESGV